MLAGLRTFQCIFTFMQFYSTQAQIIDKEDYVETYLLYNKNKLPLDCRSVASH